MFSFLSPERRVPRTVPLVLPAARSSAPRSRAAAPGAARAEVSTAPRAKRAAPGAARAPRAKRAAPGAARAAKRTSFAGPPVGGLLRAGCAWRTPSYGAGRTSIDTRGGRSESSSRTTTTCGGPSTDGSARSTPGPACGRSTSATAGASRVGERIVGAMVRSGWWSSRRQKFAPSTWPGRSPLPSWQRLRRARCVTKGARRVR
jgi:hypothetical protein